MDDAMPSFISLLKCWEIPTAKEQGELYKIKEEYTKLSMVPRNFDHIIQQAKTGGILWVQLQLNLLVSSL